MLMQACLKKRKVSQTLLAYCEGVGNLVTGPIYKAMGVSFVSGIAGALAAYLMSVIGEEYNEKYLEMELVTEKMTELARRAEPALFECSGNPRCERRLCSLRDANRQLEAAANSAARWVVVFAVGLQCCVLQA